jgi:flavin reductase (DIM6/NTAB) family NADH-FMN oxidoreductase RutF
LLWLFTLLFQLSLHGDPEDRKTGRLEDWLPKYLREDWKADALNSSGACSTDFGIIACQISVPLHSHSCSRPSHFFDLALGQSHILCYKMLEQEKTDAESSIQRNPHPDFATVEASRPDYEKRDFQFSKTIDPNWKYGSGGNDGGASLDKNHIDIDPYAEGRQPAQNYKLLISGIVPRPIGFLSTRSKDGSTTNLSPFSYTQVINHDPPLFIVGFAGGMNNAKDSLRNLIESRECTINMVSEHFIEAANATSIDAPYGVSEWALTGLHPAPCKDVQCSRVKEAVFSVEGRLVDTREFESRTNPGKKTGVMAIIEGCRFWVREDAIDQTRSLIDPNVLRPMARLGGISYARIIDGLEIPRPVMAQEQKAGKVDESLLKPKVDGQ